MSDMIGNARPSELIIQAVVIRCGCGQPQRHDGAPCPLGRAVDLGQIAYWHRNPLRRLAHWLTHRRRPQE